MHDSGVLLFLCNDRNKYFDQLTLQCCNASFAISDINFWVAKDTSLRTLGSVVSKPAVER